MMPCTCRIEATDHPYGNTTCTEEIAVKCESCRKGELLEMATRNEWAIRTIARNADALRVFIDRFYDVDNHRMPDQKEYPFSGAGEVMEALELLWEADL